MSSAKTEESSTSHQNDEVEQSAAEKSTAETQCSDQRIEVQGSTEPDGSARDSISATPPTTPKVSRVSKADAPIMKQKKWEVEPEKKIGAIVEFIKKYLKLQKTDSLFLYVNQSFAPAPDQTVKNLYECFGADGKLVLHYCKSQAWG